MSVCIAMMIPWAGERFFSKAGSMSRTNFLCNLSFLYLVGFPASSLSVKRELYVSHIAPILSPKLKLIYKRKYLMDLKSQTIFIIYFWELPH